MKTHRPALRRFAILAFALLAPALPAWADDGPASASTTLQFEGSSYRYRWSQDGLYEFTPAGQEDLDHWQDMLSVAIKREVQQPEQLAALANALLASYQAHGKILATDSRPMTADTPAEHLIVAAMSIEDVVEVVFARLVLVDGTGEVVVYSKRMYGKDNASEVANWINTQASTKALALTKWQHVPSASELATLPAPRR